jgi:dynactin 1
MFFQRLAHKADLINTVVAQAHGIPDSLNGSVSEVLVGVCEVSITPILVSSSMDKFSLW